MVEGRIGGETEGKKGGLRWSGDVAWLIREKQEWKGKIGVIL